MRPCDVNVRLDSPLHAAWNTPPAAPTHVLVAYPDGHAELSDVDGVRQTWPDPLRAIDWLGAEALNTPDTRWVGYFSYDLTPWLEPAVSLRHRPTTPLLAFARVPKLALDFNDLVPWLRSVTPVVSNFTRAGYERAVARAIEFVEAGDVFQVNLSQRFSGPCPGDLSAIYRTLRANRPAAYGGFLRFDDLSLLCHSPELFLNVDPNGAVRTRPIKGTRPAAPGMAAELLGSTKDQAELNMIVDLERNDLGRVCRIGSVRVTEPRHVEAHPTVLHGVAEVSGQLRPGVGLLDLLRATFPGGSITGAPKVRAIQIIDQLEPGARGPYCGAIGYLDADGSMQFNVAIRTMIAHHGRLVIPVGGGIVADSVPAQEFEETLVKAAAMFEAVGANLTN